MGYSLWLGFPQRVLAVSWEVPHRLPHRTRTFAQGSTTPSRSSQPWSASLGPSDVFLQKPDKSLLDALCAVFILLPDPVVHNISSSILLYRGGFFKRPPVSDGWTLLGPLVAPGDPGGPGGHTHGQHAKEKDDGVGCVHLSGDVDC